MGDGLDPLLVGIPPRLDRRLKLGPFASGREALRLVLYLAAAALVASRVDPLVALPVAGFGAVSVTWRPGGAPLDERVAAMVTWGLRRAARAGPMTRAGVPAPLRRAWIAVGRGAAAGIVRSGGVPLAYLPAPDLRQRFERFRELLTASGGRLAFFVTSAPIHPEALVPAVPSPGGPEGTARSGYRELVELIARRRSVRQVYFAVVGDGTGAPALLRLEAELAGAAQRLGSLGVRPTRLRGGALRAAADRMGLLVAEGSA